MSDIGLILNAVLGLLLVGALFMGWRLEARLKALRASHQSFTRAVEDLDRAAGRAEQGLADLRAATDEAADSLAARIERATHLAGQLEKLTADAESARARLAAAPRLAAPPAELRPAPVRAPEQPRPAQSREEVLARFSERFAARPAPAALAEAAARNDLILEDEAAASAPPTPAELRPGAPASRLTPDAQARIERLRALAAPKPALRAAAAPRRAADDELFEAPRRAAGGYR
ncbi:MAG TPA: DUF6468 domain-containing protein [Caulobacteraceae bacterium]|nr:DUF6468 domain-containing protein [Caulobacteraceae bacterium]